MGFLDFLKKDKGSAPQDGQSIDVSDVERKIGLGPDDPFGSPSNKAPPDVVPPPPPSAGSFRDSSKSEFSFDDGPIPPKNAPGRPSRDIHPDNPIPTGSMMANPIRRDDSEDFGGDDDFDAVPVPPPSMQDPDFLTSAADDFFGNSERDKHAAMAQAPAKPHETKPAPLKPVPPPKPPVAKPVPPKPAPAPPQEDDHSFSIDLPDFTDDDIEEVSRHHEPRMDMAEPEHRDDVPPPEGHPAFGKLKPAMFLSSESYFALANDIKEVRRVLRDNDEVLKDAALDHEKGDEQLEKVAVEMNAIQEQFMHLDGALFEE